MLERFNASMYVLFFFIIPFLFIGRTCCHDQMLACMLFYFFFIISTFLCLTDVHVVMIQC